MPDSKLIRVSVVYVLPCSLFQKELLLAQGSSVAEAIAKSGLAQAHPLACGPELKCGIFSLAAEPTTLLHDGDRIEIYRPLHIDPKQARRKRASRTQT